MSVGTLWVERCLGLQKIQGYLLNTDFKLFLYKLTQMLLKLHALPLATLPGHGFL